MFFLPGNREPTKLITLRRKRKTERSRTLTLRSVLQEFVWIKEVQCQADDRLAALIGDGECASAML